MIDWLRGLLITTVLLGVGCGASRALERKPAIAAAAVPDARPEAARAFEDGIRLLGQGPAHYEEARTALRRAVEIDKNLYEAWHNLGYLDARQGRWSEAVASFARALAIQPASRVSMMGLAQARFRSGQHDAAQALYRKWAEAYPDDLELELAYIASLRDGGKPKQALAAVQKILAKDSHSAAGFNALGLVYRRLQRLSLAETAFRRAIELDGKAPHVWNNLGLLALDRGDNQTAFAHFQRATEIDPRYAEALINKAVVYMDCGAYDLALTELERAVALQDRDPDMHVTLGVAARGAGKLDKALTHYQRALELHPDYPPALYNIGVLFMDHKDDPRRARESLLLFRKVASADDPKQGDAKLRLQMLKGAGSS